VKASLVNSSVKLEVRFLSYNRVAGHHRERPERGIRRGSLGGEKLGIGCHSSENLVRFSPIYSDGSVAEPTGGIWSGSLRFGSKWSGGGSRWQHRPLLMRDRCAFV